MVWPRLAGGFRRPRSRSHSLPSPLSDRLVYIVDDDDDVRDSLKLLLEAHGLTVADFASPEEFITQYRPQQHSCLVLDQHLPTISGLEFLASREQPLDLPVIMVTGRGDSSIRARAFEVGVTAYFEKPVADDQLVVAIQQALECRPERPV